MDTAPWLDLPLEIVEQVIIPLCDNESLLALSKTCHLLNRLALVEFFKRNGIDCPSEGYFVSYLAPKDHIPALHAALWMNDLPTIMYHFNPDIQRLFFETRGLTALIGRLQKVDSLYLDFCTIDLWLARVEPWDEDTNRKPVIEQDIWKDTFCRLLDVAVEKKVRSIRVERGCNFHSYYESAALDDVLEDTRAFDEVPQDLPVKEETLSRWINILRRIPRLIPLLSFSPFKKAKKSKRKKNKMCTITTNIIPVTSNIHSCIHRIYLSSSMMMQPLFRPYTINLLRNHSDTLRHIVFSSLRASYSVWMEIFDNIHLPQLEVFVYEYDTLVVCNATLDYQILFSFLVRHPTITMLKLYGVVLPNEFPALKHGILPNLKTLDAHPRMISHIISNPTYCPALESISVSSEYCVLLDDNQDEDDIPDPYEDFDKTLLMITSLRRLINLRLKFSTQRRLSHWLLQHTTDNPTHIIPQLTAIENLTISCHYHTKFLDKHKAILPRFFALFPSLKYLRLMDIPQQKEIIDETFLKSIAEAVPNLVSFLIGTDMIVGEPKAILEMDSLSSNFEIFGEVW